MEQSAANPTQQPLYWTEQVLTRAIASVRARPDAAGRLWESLLRMAPESEAALREALLAWHGISVLSNDEWAQTRHDPGAGIRAGQGVNAYRIGDELYLVCSDPWDPAVSLLVSRLGAAHRLALAQSGQMTPSAQEHVDASIAKSSGPEPLVGNADSSEVVEFVDDAIRKAYSDGASDVHFETSRHGITIKYRIDGVMVGGAQWNDAQRAEEVVSRIKVLAQLDITERRRPQDGRIHWSKPGHDTVDLRVSVMPSIHGEDVVLRLLDKAQLRQSHQAMSLELLGFDEPTASIIRDLASRPHGMLLVTGPTGSGKTTTVYAALVEVNNGLEKFVTIEDPVEYELPGVLQIPVNEKKGLTFASGLRSILRHDPDKILVGEIRDAETAEIAIQSSLTGHVVFTTVHANSLFDVLGRFQHFSIDPFALASALNGVVIQRLLRRVCPSCMTWQETSEWPAVERDIHGTPDTVQAPKAQGCPKCRNTGYSGRFVVAEVHLLNDRVRDLIVAKASLSELRKQLYSDSNASLLARALVEVRKGQTTLEEVRRVVGLA